MKVLSLGAGVQSSTVLLMSISGELPKLDAVIFADTGWEPPEVYKYLEYLQTLHPIYIVSVGNIREDVLMSQVRDTKRWTSIPLYTKDKDGNVGSIRRQCTNEYKITPIRRKIRELLNNRKPKRSEVELWMGISFDERQRCSYSKVQYIDHYYPLVDMEMTRHDCLKWIDKHKLPIPSRSACIGCPYHSNVEWKAIKADPVTWKDAVSFDKAIRNKGGMRGQLFLHRSCKPLDEIDFDTAENKGQLNWLTECAGICGV